MEFINYYISNNVNQIILGLLIVSFLLLVLLFINMVSVGKWKKKYNNFIKQNKDFNIEDVLVDNIKNINILKELNDKNKKEIERLEKYVEISYQKLGIVRYNAFKEMGGNLSFVIALLNQENTGILLNGIHSREGCYIYLKNVEDAKTEKILSDEEKTALQMAVKQN